MKLINLVFQGITAREETYDFGNKAAGCIVLQDADKNALKEALSFAFYGSVDPTRYTLPLVVSAKFMLDDIEYDLTRALVREPSGAVAEKVALSDLNTGVIYGEGKEDIDSYLLAKIGLDKDAFEKLLFVDEELTSPIAENLVTRESFVAEQIASLATSQKVIGKYNELKADEEELMAYIEGIESVTRDEIKEQQLRVDNDKLSLEALRNQIADVNIEIMNAEKYREELDTYNAVNAKMDAVSSKEAEMQELASKAARSEEAKEIADVFYKYQETMKGLEAIEASIIAQTEELDAMEAKIGEAKGSEKLLGDEYAQANIRATELNAKMREIIKEGAINPQGVKIKEIIESYYAETAPEIEELKAKKKDIDASYDALVKEIAELQERKVAIRDSAEYKKAVQDGAVLEGNLAQAESTLKESQERIEALEKRRADLYDQNVVYAGKAKELNTEVQKMEKELKGSNGSVQDTINQDALYKQTIYTKHLFVSDHEVSLDAVNKKIEAVKATAESYGDKLNTLSKRRAEVMVHRAKLQDKLALLNEKLMEYMSFNRLRDISNEIAYGTRCPVCDGFVAQKKELPLRDTKALDDQIKAVQAEIKKDDDALMGAESTIGQYQAATAVSNQYLESLVATKRSHEEAIDSVLKEYNVGSIAELFALTGKAVASSNELIKKVDLYNKKRAELIKVQEANTLIVEQIKDIDSVQLPRELKVSAEIEQLIVDTKSAYDAMADYYQGESAIALLEKLQVVENEYEQIEKSLEEKEVALNEVKAEKEEVDARLTALTARTIVLSENGLELTYSDVVTKAYSDLLSAICAEIDKSEEVKERAKLRLHGLKKVTADMETKRDELRETIIARVASLESAQDTVAEMYAEYEKKFDDLGIKSEADLNALVMSEAELESAKAVVFAYDEEVAVTRDELKNLNEAINAHIGYYENYESNVALLEDLRNQEVEAVLNLSNEKAILEDMEYRYAELINSNKALAFVQAKIKGIDDLSGAIKEGAVIASDLAGLIVQKANAIVKLASKDRYYIDQTDDGKIMLYINGKGKVRADKPTREEKVLLPFAIAKAYNEVMVALLAGDTVSAMVVDQDRNDKQSLSPIVEYSKEEEIVVIPQEEKSFLNAISKLA